MANPWHNQEQIGSYSYTCGHCGKIVGSDRGYYKPNSGQKIYICPFCDKPSFFESTQQVPGVAYGNAVSHLPNDVASLYNEARNCMSVASHTAAVLICRKLLMNIAVNQKASPGEPFIKYVEFLAANGYVPPHGRGWVDHIRNKGNEANHEIRCMSKQDAEELISFVEMLLKFIYEFPSSLPKPGP